MALTVNRNSWHYKIATWNGDWNLPSNLCDYFWLCVRQCGTLLFWFVFITFIAVLFVGLNVGPIVDWVVWDYTGYRGDRVFLLYLMTAGHPEWAAPITSPLTNFDHFISFLLWTIELIVGTAAWFEYTKSGQALRNRIIDWEIDRTLNPKPKREGLNGVGLVIEFLKAKKQRFCPTIEYVD